MRDFDLQLALQRARALRENIEDKLATVDDAKIEILLEVARLCGAECIVENRERCTVAMRNFLDLRSFAFADKRTRVRRLELLRYCIGNLGAGRLGEGL